MTLRNLCNGMKKQTGKPGKKNDRILCCIKIKCKIMDKTHVGVLRIDESKDEEEVADGGEGEQGGGNALHCSPPCTSKT